MYKSLLAHHFVFALYCLKFLENFSCCFCLFRDRLSQRASHNTVWALHEAGIPVQLKVIGLFIWHNGLWFELVSGIRFFSGWPFLNNCRRFYLCEVRRGLMLNHACKTWLGGKFVSTACISLRVWWPSCQSHKCAKLPIVAILRLDRAQWELAGKLVNGHVRVCFRHFCSILCVYVCRRRVVLSLVSCIEYTSSRCQNGHARDSTRCTDHRGG